MSERSESPDEGGTKEASQKDELRTITFRLREIQRLLATRVEQENRRLEADGIEPVTDREFSRTADEEE